MQTDRAQARGAMGGFPMARDTRGRRREMWGSTLLATALACAVLLPLLGHRMLTNWDEGIYAEVSREMLSTGWLVPHWNGQVWFEKPPLMLWVTAVFFKLFGVTEFWARAGSASSGVAIVALLHGWLARRGQMITAWFGTLILLGTFGFLHVCRVGEMDVLLSLGCVIGLYGLTTIDEREDGCKLEGWYWFWGGFAIAAMTKGGASLVLPLTAILFALVERWGAIRFGMSFRLGLGVFLLLVLPWHLWMLHKFGRSFLDEYLGFHVLARAARPIEGHSTQWWYYFRVLLVSAAPFVLLYPLAIVDALRRRRLSVWAIFALVVVGLFSIAQTRLPHYVAPAYPALAVVTAGLLAARSEGFFARYWRGGRFVQRSVPGWILVGAIAMVVWGASALVTGRARRQLHSAIATAYDDKEPVLLLREVLGRQGMIDGVGAAMPILTWWEGDRRSIAMTVFYAERSVQQVQPGDVQQGTAFDRYTFDPVSFEQAFGRAMDGRARLILLDTNLVPQLPGGFVYERLAVGRTMEIGLIRRRSSSAPDGAAGAKADFRSGMTKKERSKVLCITATL